ncbi:DUF2510 domain-containing protein [Agromyces mariniharenae]|uniref:DUF2510 domain-containing protein n=1 Tax=Agromyces mariniharenae TaxID=2604423 RepID=UPI001EE576FF|nr:DUF2510 domain-containing protein [Agromyces mariniharenae]
MGEPGKAPAGWYDDGAGSLRYWDGDSWTEHTSAIATATAAATATATPGEPPSEARRSNAYGIGALTAALVGFVLIRLPFEIPAFVGVALLLVGLVIAIIAIVVIGREWRAVTALVVSIIGLATSIIAFTIGALSVIPATLDEMSGGVPTSDVQQPTVEPEPESTAEPDEIEDPVKGDFPGMIAPTSPGVPFGQTMSWEDGVTMTVTPPEPYVPTEFATGGGANNVVFALTITNGSPGPINLLTYSQVTSAGQPGSIVYDVLDSGEEISAEPSGVLEPGQSVTWREAWAVADPNAITLLDSPTVDHVEVTFTNEQ